MDVNVIFRRQIIEGLIGGLSPLDGTSLRLTDEEEAQGFLKAYGYDPASEEDAKILHSIHQRAVVFLKEHLLRGDEQIPGELLEINNHGVPRLLYDASRHSHQPPEIKAWCCALLKVMHVYAHLESDIFHLFPEEIKSQILKPFRNALREDPIKGKTILGKSSEEEHVVLEKFEVKPTKSVSSSVIKLLAKREAHALTLMDKIGVRFVTKGIFDAYRVLRYLHLNSLISFPHSLSDQVTNTLYPVSLFFEVMDEFRTKGANADADEVEATLVRKLKNYSGDVPYLIKGNHFSGSDYKFMKFITRRLIKIQLPEVGRTVRFFYPFEIQLMDYETYLQSLQGDQSHKAYKARQLESARSRILGFLEGKR